MKKMKQHWDNYASYLRLYFAEADDTDEEGDNAEEEDKGGDDRKKPKYSDEDLDRIIDKKMKRWQKQQKAAVDEATRLANMTAQERAEHERDTVQKELDALKAKNARAELEKAARKILQDDGVNVSDAIVATLIGKDADETNANVKAFAENYKAAILDGVKASLSHGAPKTGAAGTAPTREEIRKEKNTQRRLAMYRQQMGIK